MASKLQGILLLVAITSSSQACEPSRPPFRPIYPIPGHAYTASFFSFVSYDEFRQASGGSSAQYDIFNKYAYTVGQISSKEEAAMALAQILHSSANLTARRELGCDESSPCTGRYVSACDVPGQSYYGRGYLQLRWCYNYRDASTAIFGDSTVLLNDPDKVAKEDELAWHTAFWLWGARVHNHPGVQYGQFGATTKALAPEECAPGNESREQREKVYANVRRALGLSGAGNLSGCF